MRFCEALTVLVLNLFSAWRVSPELQLGISLRRGSYTGSRRYGNPLLTYRAMKAVFDGLRHLGYQTVDKLGVYDKEKGTGYVTRIRATPKLIELLAEAKL